MAPRESILPLSHFASARIACVFVISDQSSHPPIIKAFVSVWSPFLETPENFSGPKLRSAYSITLTFCYDFKIRKGKFVAKFHSWKMSSFLRYAGKIGPNCFENEWKVFFNFFIYLKWFVDHHQREDVSQRNNLKQQNLWWWLMASLLRSDLTENEWTELFRRSDFSPY